MQHLGEICTEQRSCGKSKQNKNHVKPRKEIQKRSFWRRFFSSFLSLLKEKRPPEAKRRADSHASDVGHWLGMTPLRGVRGGQSRPPLRRGTRGCGRGMAGRCTPRVLVPLRSTAWASPPTEGLSGVGSYIVSPSVNASRCHLPHRGRH